MLDNDMRLKRLLIMTYMYAYIHIYKECLTTVQTRPGFKNFLQNVCPLEGFVKACQVGWSATCVHIMSCFVLCIIIRLRVPSSPRSGERC